MVAITDLTTGTLDGSGMFDTLMASVSAHLKNEYTQKRITGSDYSKAYLGGLQAVLAQSVQFALQAPITTSQVALTDAQKLLVDEQISEITKRLEVGGLADQQVNQVIATINQTDAQKLLTDQQIAELVKRLEAGGLDDQKVLQVVASINQTDAQTTLLGTQNTKAGSENALIISQKSKVDTDKLIADKQLLITTEEVNTQAAKTQLITDQTLKETASKDLLVEQTTSAAYQRTDIMPQQKAKLTNEATLIQTKVETEHAQFADTLLDNVTSVAGTIGKQNLVLSEQQNSYKRNNEYKVAKMMMDNHSVSVNAGQVVDRGAAGTADANIGSVLAQVKTNLNLPTV